MFDGEIHQLDANGALNILKFDQSTFDLSPFVREDGSVTLKASDRYLHELPSPGTPIINSALPS